MANKIYDNVVISNVLKSALTTKLNMQNFMTVDESLTQEAGMIKRVNTRVATGDVENLNMGEGNTSDIEVNMTSADYKATTTQGRFAYYDEEAAADDKVVEAGITGLTEKMMNDYTAKAVAEFEKATLTVAAGATGITFENVVDAIAKLNVEDEAGLFMLINPEQQAALRKNLGESLKYAESFARTGYIGSVCGVPVYVSKAVQSAVIASKAAVTLFLKKDIEIEQDRDKNTRKNIIYARRVGVVALTDATKAVKFTA